MELGIQGRRAFVAASSQGLGFACAVSLAREGVRVTLNGRDEEKLAKAAELARAAVPGAVFDVVAADLTTGEGRDRITTALPHVDILVTNNAGPAPGELGDWDAASLVGAMQANTIPAVELMRHSIPGMRERRFGRVVNITSAMVLPERIDTPRQEFMALRLMERDGVDRTEARRRIASTIAAKRLARPEEFGDTCAFVCSAQAGSMSGQNIQVDGGSSGGLL